jgi:hypothetical protein
MHEGADLFLNFVPFFHLLLDIEQKILICTFSCSFHLCSHSNWITDRCSSCTSGCNYPFFQWDVHSNCFWTRNHNQSLFGFRCDKGGITHRPFIGLGIWSIYVLDYMPKAGCQRQLPLQIEMVTKEKQGGFVSNEALILELNKWNSFLSVLNVLQVSFFNLEWFSRSK